MAETVSTYAGLACAALVLAGFVPGISDAASATGTSRQEMRVSVKGDLLASPRPAPRNEVASVRTEGGLDRLVLSMRTRTGLVAYHADNGAQTSIVAKNVLIPGAPDRGAAPAAMAQEPVPAKVETPRKLPLGCERLVSVLVKSAERDLVGRCLA